MAADTFVKVYLARAKSKYILLLRCCSNHCYRKLRRERNPITFARHPHILRLYAYFILEYAPWGELYKELQEILRFGSSSGTLLCWFKNFPEP